LVLTQPTSGTVKAFSAVCTHKGCPVKPEGGKLHCPCHDSSFDISNGAVLAGPATSPLPPFNVKVSNGNVMPA
jgi:Rieske Fe-S protein